MRKMPKSSSKLPKSSSTEVSLPDLMASSMQALPAKGYAVWIKAFRETRYVCKLFVVPRCELGMLKTEKASDRCEVYYMKETISDRLVFPKTKQKETNQKTKNRTMRIVGSPMRFVFFWFCFVCVLLFLFVFSTAFYVFRWQFPHMCQTRGSEYRCFLLIWIKKPKSGLRFCKFIALTLECMCAVNIKRVIFHWIPQCS